MINYIIVKKIFKRIAAFFKNHPIIANLIYIIITACIILWLTLIWLDVWTGHGDYREVPDVKGLTYDKASILLQGNDLQAVLSDSVFSNDVAPGQIVEQVPKPGAKVKPDRAVYIIINAYSPRAVTMPNLTDISLRQARSIIEGLGIKKINVVEVPSEYKDLVMCVKYNGLPISAGMRVPVTASLTIEVGRGYEEGDSIAAEELNVEEIVDEDIFN